MSLLLPIVLHPLLHHHLDAEILSVGSAKDMIIFLPSVKTRVLFISEQGEWESRSEHEDNGRDNDDESREETSCISNIQSDQGVALFPVECLVLMQLEKRGRYNIFHTRATTKNKVCSIIVDNGSCNNIANSDLVERLGVRQTRHTSP
jgi:hypothetical protein